MWLQPHWSEGDSTLGWFTPPRKSLVDSSSLLLACSLSFPKSSLPTWGGGASLQYTNCNLSPLPFPPPTGTVHRTQRKTQTSQLCSSSFHPPPVSASGASHLLFPQNFSVGSHLVTASQLVVTSQGLFLILPLPG